MRIALRLIIAVFCVFAITAPTPSYMSQGFANLLNAVLGVMGASWTMLAVMEWHNLETANDKHAKPDPSATE